MTQPVILDKKVRKYVAADFKVTDWEHLKPMCDELMARDIESKDALEAWLTDRSELEMVINEDHYWRYINKTRDTENTDFDETYNYFVEHIQPHLMTVSNALNKKLYKCPYLKDLDQKRFGTYLRAVKNNIELFCEANIPLFTKLEKESKKYYGFSGKMSIEHNGKEMTMQQANKFLEEKDRELRASIHRKMTDRRLQDVDALDELFDGLVKIRHEVAKNAGYENYRDFKLQELGRFDYGVAECELFHESVEKEIVPLVNELMKARKAALNVDTLRPYDTSVNTGKQPIATPFADMEELVSKSIDCLANIDPYFAGCLMTMNNMEHLDLESRKGKAPGGYNCGLPETGVPFIFMNAASTAGDVRTMIHEGGHAVHSFLMNDLKYVFDGNITSEAAELASMTMELFALDSYDAFYPDEEQRNLAIKSSLENMIVLIPWIALVDKFQHWIYTNPGHTADERRKTWLEFHKRFSSDVIDWTGFETARENLWQRQLHIFLIPFYYIEYGIAQFGAIGMWRNFQKDAASTIVNYKKALSLGSTATLPEMYGAAGVPFDFSRDYIRELKEFVKEQMA